ncbi:MAG: hypothetical protein J3K34DRAFT_365445 [Monoraphidium minutum]|nr:MAG: hypothetical protein J3K34DRAFT_365445 [Monoraphidium minutum]
MRCFAADAGGPSEGAVPPASAAAPTEGSSSSSSSSSRSSEPSSSGLEAGAGAAAAPPPSGAGRAAPPAGVASGARLVQPLRRGGPTVAAREGVVHINCSLNNTHIVLTDLQGLVQTYTSGGSVGFKNANKSTPLAAERAAAELAKRALEKGFFSVSVRLRGMGRNKQVAVQALAAAGVSVTQLREVTPTAYNGCRLPRKRRV